MTKQKERIEDFNGPCQKTNLRLYDRLPCRRNLRSFSIFSVTAVNDTTLFHVELRKTLVCIVKMLRSKTKRPTRPDDLKIVENGNGRVQNRPDSVDSGIGLETPDRALSPVSSIGSSTPSRGPTPTHGWVNSVHVWILVCLQYITLCLRRLSQILLLLLQAEVNKKSLKEGKEELSDSETIEEALKGLSVNPTHQDVITLKNGYLPSRNKAVPRTRLFRAVPAVPPLAEDEGVDSVQLLCGSVSETRIITTVFEITGAGIGPLLTDLDEEMHRWFHNQGILVVCTEVVWSVPEKRRDSTVEMRMKDGLLRALRGNNRRVLDLNFGEKKNEDPIILPQSVTEEVSGREGILGTYQGIYRRYYGGLLSFGHKETSIQHRAYWELNKSQLRPNPQNFLMGNGRKVSELTKTSLVAINLVTIKLRK